MVLMADLSAIGSTGENEVDLESLRTRLREMNDAELLRFCRAAQYMCSPHANMGKPPREVFVVRLEEARAELERRRNSH